MPRLTKSVVDAAEPRRETVHHLVQRAKGLWCFRVAERMPHVLRGLSK